jgi:hypothetical protein
MFVEGYKYYNSLYCNIHELSINEVCYYATRQSEKYSIHFLLKRCGCVCAIHNNCTIAHITQHSALSTQHSALSTQHSALSTQHSALSTQHSALSTRHSSALSTQHTVLLTTDYSTIVLQSTVYSLLYSTILLSSSTCGCGGLVSGLGGCTLQLLLTNFEYYSSTSIQLHARSKNS